MECIFKYLFGEINMKKIISILAIGLFLVGCCCHKDKCHTKHKKCHCHEVTKKIHHEHGCK